MNAHQLKKLVGRRITKTAVTDHDEFGGFNATLDNGQILQVLFFEKHGGTVKIVDGPRGMRGNK